MKVYLVIRGTPSRPEMILGVFSKREYASQAVDIYMMDPEITQRGNGFSVVGMPVDQGIKEKKVD